MIWIGAFSNLFGAGRLKPIPRVSILEIFAEYHDDELTAAEIIEMTEVSKRSVYMILEDLVKEGLVVKIGDSGRPGRYMLNNNDVRSRTLSMLEQLIVLGNIESQIKEDRGMNQWDIIEESLLLNPNFMFSIRPTGRKSAPQLQNIEGNTGWSETKERIGLADRIASSTSPDYIPQGSFIDDHIRQSIGA